MKNLHKNNNNGVGTANVATSKYLRFIWLRTWWALEYTVMILRFP
jgi:hypothetical protein